MARSLNKVSLIGNLTRDPELRYTPQGSAVCSFSVATNRQWTTDAGEKKEDAEFHRIVSWNKLAEICAQLLKKGRKVFVEGRLQTRNWTTQDGQQRQTTEVVISDMILLDSRGSGGGADDFDVPDSALEGDLEVPEPEGLVEETTETKKDKEEKTEEKPKTTEEKTPKAKTDKKATKEEKEEDNEDIPF